jgi:UDP-N-acetylglucosamine 2-epimerase (non-hydrolysing)
VKTLLCVIGTRPEAIKMAPVVVEARRRGRFRVVLCSSGQHREMLHHGLEPFGLAPDLDLRALEEGQGLDGLTARLLNLLSNCLREHRPDAVLVHGDTQTCLCAAQAAFWHRTPVGHVEAGLRSQVRDNPFPEEMNRRLTDVLCEWHFAPTAGSRENLLREGIPADGILVTGNTAIDAIHLAGRTLQQRRPAYVDFDPSALDGRRLVLVTGHRRENHGKHLKDLCLALLDVVRADSAACVVYPVHLNPNVQRVVNEVLRGQDRVYLIPPQPYLPFVDLMYRSRVIVTDSGGIQEEAPSLGKTVLVTRQNTERPEMLTTGLVRLVGNSRERIRSETLHSLGNRVCESIPDNPCGDGRAAKRIADFLEERLLGEKGRARWVTPAPTGVPVS